MIELSWRGERPIALPSGETRAFLENGDTIVLRGWAGSGPNRVDFGEVRGTIAG
jgi:fumarylacetoacetase